MCGIFHRGTHPFSKKIKISATTDVGKGGIAGRGERRERRAECVLGLGVRETCLAWGWNYFFFLALRTVRGVFAFTTDVAARGLTVVLVTTFAGAGRGRGAVAE